MIKPIANWGNYPVIESEELSFRSVRDLRDVVQQDRPMIARGNGRCYGDASLSEVTISTLYFDKILSFDTSAGIIDCQSGIVLDRLLEVIVPKGWFLPVTPGTKFVTIGGMVASDVHGKNHHVDGSFSRHVEELTVMLSSGEVVRCSRTERTDLFEATCGGMGLTGVILTARFALKKIETAYIRQHIIKSSNLDELLGLFDKYSHTTYSVAWIDCLKRGSGFGRSVLLLGEHASTHDLNDRQRALGPLRLPSPRSLPFPFTLPSWVLNNITVRAFNFLYYHKNLKKERHVVTSYEPFFYPLDAILHWNRGYGRKGFVQYQFVIPLDKREGLVHILERISAKGWGSFLAVLKIFGAQAAETGIPFPFQGFTLALDFPVRDGLFPFLEELDEIVLEYGGRLYLSKDARMEARTFWKGYNGSAEAFTTVVQQYNPGEKFRSVQSARLAITR